MATASAPCRLETRERQGWGNLTLREWADQSPLANQFPVASAALGRNVFVYTFLMSKKRPKKHKRRPKKKTRTE